MQRAKVENLDFEKLKANIHLLSIQIIIIKKFLSQLDEKNKYEYHPDVIELSREIEKFGSKLTALDESNFSSKDVSKEYARLEEKVLQLFNSIMMDEKSLNEEGKRKYWDIFNGSFLNLNQRIRNIRATGELKEIIGAGEEICESFLSSGPKKLHFYKVAIRDIDDFSKYSIMKALNWGLSRTHTGEYKLYRATYCEHPEKEAENKRQFLEKEYAKRHLPNRYYDIVIGINQDTDQVEELHYIGYEGHSTFKFPFPIKAISVEKIAEYFEKFAEILDQELINKWAILIDAKEKLDNEELNNKGTPLAFWKKVTPENVIELRKILKDLNKISKDEIDTLYQAYLSQIKQIKPNKRRDRQVQALYNYLLLQTKKNHTPDAILFNTATTYNSKTA